MSNCSSTPRMSNCSCTYLSLNSLHLLKINLIHLWSRFSVFYFVSLVYVSIYHSTNTTQSWLLWEYSKTILGRLVLWIYSLFKIELALGLLPFHINVKINLSVFLKIPWWNFIEIALTLKINLDNTDTFASWYMNIVCLSIYLGFIWFH